MERFSRKLYHTLDNLGYNRDMIQYRRESWKLFSDMCSKYSCNGLLRGITAGSKGEGITAPYESDTDIMLLDDNTLIIHTTEQLPSQLPNHMTVMLADMENVPPGYTRLKLHRPASLKNKMNELMRACLYELRGEFYLSSTMLTANIKKGISIDKSGFTTHDVSGPALPVTQVQVIDYDLVYGFTFHCPQLLQTWASRRRKHEWPSEDIIRTACSFQPQVVPVGAKGSDRKDHEWRFCFIESELTLTRSLNGTQIKLYILLKMIAKHILKPVTSEISSYIMKNIIYWLSELLPVSVFREEKLASLVLLALKVLRTSITRWQNLPYYMIPSRNLLSERQDANTRSELSDILNRLIHEGPRLFLRIEKLRKYLEMAYRSPDNIVQFGNMRDQLEKQLLTFFALGRLKDYGLLPHYFNNASLLFSIMILVIQIHVLLRNHSRHGMFVEGDALESCILS